MSNQDRQSDLQLKTGWNRCPLKLLPDLSLCLLSINETVGVNKKSLWIKTRPACCAGYSAHSASFIFIQLFSAIVVFKNSRETFWNHFSNCSPLCSRSSICHIFQVIINAQGTHHLQCFMVVSFIWIRELAWSQVDSWLWSLHEFNCRCCRVAAGAWTGRTLQKFLLV